jgi:hypothetical protein
MGAALLSSENNIQQKLNGSDKHQGATIAGSFLRCTGVRIANGWLRLVGTSRLG